MRRQRERGRSDRAFVVINGRRHKLGVWGSQAAERRYLELVGGADPTPLKALPSDVPPDNPSVAELMVPFLKDILARFEDNRDEQAHFRGAMRVLKELFSELPADQFGPRRLRQVQAAMVEKGWSRRYVNSQVGRVRRLFKWAAADERIDAGVHHALLTVEPLTKGRTKAPDPDPVEPVEDAVVDATIPHLNPVVADMVAIQRLCGCRPKELCSMTADQIDRSGDVWLYRPTSHKTTHHGKRRVIVIGPKVQRVLTPYLFGGGSLFRPPRRPDSAYTADSYRQAVRRGCEKAWPAPKGLSHKEKLRWNREHRWAPNQLRHSVGTLVRREFGLEAAQHVLGHARADVTQVYAERDLAKAIEVARQIG